MGLQIQVLNASTSGEINAAFATFVRERPDALFVGTGPFLTNRRVQLVLLAGRHRIPAIYGARQYSEAGGLMNYGPNIVDAHRQIGAYTGRILKDAKPADLPVVQSTTIELVINAETARLLGVHHTARAACPCRRGNRIATRFAAVHESAFGTKRTTSRQCPLSGVKRTWTCALQMSAFGGKADIAPAAMWKFITIVLALGFIAATAPVPAFAQKQSCQEFCAKRCEMSSYGKNLCIPNCTVKCNQKRSESKTK